MTTSKKTAAQIKKAAEEKLAPLYAERDASQPGSPEESAAVDKILAATFELVGN